MSRIVGDIGGTNARFAWLDDAGAPLAPRSFETAHFPHIRDAVRAFAGDAPVRALCLAVACPTDGDEIRLTNNPWRFSKSALREDLGLDTLAVLNDFTALALSVPHLGPDDGMRVGGGQAVVGGPIAVLGPGTGLGVSGLLPRDGQWTPISGEGGHVSFAPVDAVETAILDWLGRRHGRVSMERVLSGQGLENRYRALAEVEGTPAGPLGAADIARQAEQGAPLALAAVVRFLAILGSFAGDVALMLGATGGVFIGGGIVPRILDHLPASPFRARFEDKGRLGPFARAIPTTVITAPFPALLGAAAHLATQKGGSA